MARYVTAGYWTRGYAEGDYTYAAASSNASSDIDAAAGFLASTAFAPAAISATAVGPYRVQQAGINPDAASTTSVGAGLKLFVGNLSAAQSAALIAAGKDISNTGVKSSALGVALASVRIKWEAEAEPGDAWANTAEPSGVWADKPEPGDTWTNTSEPSGIWTDRPEPGDTWSSF